MGFWAKLFGREEEPVSDAVKAGRERHGIEVDEMEEKVRWQPPEQEQYDPWEEMRNVRSSFFVGRWASRKIRFKPDDTGLKEKLDKAAADREEKKREKEEKRGKGGKGLD